MYNSYNKRLFDTKFKYPKSVHTDITKMVEIPYKDENGSLCIKYEKRSVNYKELYDNYKVSDFSLQNLIAIGAPLNPAPSLRQDSLSIVENLENQLANMSSYVENNCEKVENPF